MSVSRLETPRLLLRPLEPSDAPALFAYMSDPTVMRYFGMDAFTSPSQADEFLQSLEWLVQEGRAIRWAIIRKSDRAFLGTIGFHNWNRSYLRAELGYELARPYWGQGFATEAVAVVVAHGFEALGLNRIQAVVIPQNPASRRVLEKQGFTGEGLLREYLVSDGRFMDGEMLRLLRSEYQPAVFLL